MHLPVCTKVEKLPGERSIYGGFSLQNVKQKSEVLYYFQHQNNFQFKCSRILKIYNTIEASSAKKHGVERFFHKKFCFIFLI